MELTGKYIRKNVDWDPENGWQRKWTYKIGWIGSGESLHLVAMTDGMIVHEMSEKEVKLYMIENEMVFMAKHELVEFVNSTV